MGFEDTGRGGVSEEGAVVVGCMCCDLLAAIEEESGRIDTDSEKAQAREEVVKNALLQGLGRCIESGGKGLDGIIGKYDLFHKAVVNKMVSPSSILLGEVVSSYPEACAKAMMQSEDCVKAATKMLFQGDDECEQEGCEVFGKVLQSKRRGVAEAIRKAGARKDVLKGICRVVQRGGRGQAQGFKAVRILIEVEVNAGEVKEVATLTDCISSKVVEVEGEMEEDHDVYGLLRAICNESSGIREVERRGGLGAISLLASKGKVGAIDALIECEKGAGGCARIVEVGGHLSCVNVICNRGDCSEALIKCLQLLARIWGPKIEEEAWPAIGKAVNVAVGPQEDKQAGAECGANAGADNGDVAEVIEAKADDGVETDDIKVGKEETNVEYEALPNLAGAEPEEDKRAALELLIVAARDKQSKSKMMSFVRGLPVQLSLMVRSPLGSLAVKLLSLLVPSMANGDSAEGGGGSATNVGGRLVGFLRSGDGDKASYVAATRCLHFLDVETIGKGKVLEALLTLMEQEEDLEVREEACFAILTAGLEVGEESAPRVVSAITGGGAVGEAALKVLVVVTRGREDEFRDAFSGDAERRVFGPNESTREAIILRDKNL